MDTVLVLDQQPRPDLDTHCHSLQDKDISVWLSSMWWCWEISHTIFEYDYFSCRVLETANKWKPVFSHSAVLLDLGDGWKKGSHVSFSTGDDKLTPVGFAADPTCALSLPSLPSRAPPLTLQERQKWQRCLLLVADKLQGPPYVINIWIWNNWEWSLEGPKACKLQIS